MTLLDETIWLQIQQKNTHAFERYYRDHYKEFFLVSFKYTKQVTLTQEIVNDVFLKIWEGASAITIETSLKAYLYKAVINRSINAYNKSKKDLQKQKDPELVPDEGYETREMELNEMKVALYKAIDELPEQCRKVFMMSRFDQLKQQEIADKLGISIKTVKNHITHALKQISKSTGYSRMLIIILLSDFFK